MYLHEHCVEPVRAVYHAASKVLHGPARICPSWAPVAHTLGWMGKGNVRIQREECIACTVHAVITKGV